jgi:hypothetical protein
MTPMLAVGLWTRERCGYGPALNKVSPAPQTRPGDMDNQPERPPGCREHLICLSRPFQCLPVPTSGRRRRHSHGRDVRGHRPHKGGVAARTAQGADPSPIRCGGAVKAGPDAQARMKRPPEHPGPVVRVIPARVTDIPHREGDRHGWPWRQGHSARSLWFPAWMEEQSTSQSWLVFVLDVCHN